MRNAQGANDLLINGIMPQGIMSCLLIPHGDNVLEPIFPAQAGCIALWGEGHGVAIFFRKPLGVHITMTLGRPTKGGEQQM